MASPAAVAHNATDAVSGLGHATGVATESAFTWGGYFQAIGVMLLLLAGLWLCVWLLRKYGKFRFLPKPNALPRDALFMEMQLPLGPRRGLTVVRFMDKHLLLGVTESQITLLQEVPAAKDGEHEDFSTILDKQNQPAAGD